MKKFTYFLQGRNASKLDTKASLGEIEFGDMALMLQDELGSEFDSLVTTTLSLNFVHRNRWHRFEERIGQFTADFISSKWSEI